MELIKNGVKKLAKKFNIDIKKPGFHDVAFVSLKQEKSAIGNVLLSYIIDPFFLKPGEKITNKHHNNWLSWQIAQTFLEFGFDVDVVSVFNETFIPQKNYKYFVGARTNFQKIAESLNADCVKILHLTTAHWIYNNYACYKRYYECQKRKGVALEMRRQMDPNMAIEHADFCTTNKGNGFNVSTYEYINKPIFEIPLPTCSVFPWPENKDFETFKNRFVWFGSGGFIHKGLDLVLDAFQDMPDCHLTVCGPLEKEKDFVQVYCKELYRSPNIHAEGWVDINSQRFLEIANCSIGVVFPSCSEGGGASVITCMQAGLIPVVNYETNVEIGDFGISLTDCSVDDIKRAVRKICGLSCEELKERARKSWEFARVNHSQEAFVENYQKVIREIMGVGKASQHCSTLKD